MSQVLAIFQRHRYMTELLPTPTHFQLIWLKCGSWCHDNDKTRIILQGILKYKTASLHKKMVKMRGTWMLRNKNGADPQAKRKRSRRLSKTNFFIFLIIALMCFSPMYTLNSLNEPLREKYELGASKAHPSSSVLLNHKGTTCLQQNTPGLELRYPVDANDHFREIHEAVGPYLQGSPNHKINVYSGYKGPWIENEWISTFYETNKQSSIPIHELYGPFIPLFIPWVDWFVFDGDQHLKDKETGQNTPKIYPQVVDKIIALLRKDVPYITLAQNDGGVLGLNLTEYPNVLVLSAGGYGHVPVPLLKQEEVPQNHLIPPKDRKNVFNYVGSPHNAPRFMRQDMLDIMAEHSHKFARKKITSDNLPQKHLWEYAHSSAWRQIMTNSLFSFSPRGYGRTSFHVYEALHMGLIPVQIFTDQPWIPYGDVLLNRDDPLVYTANNEGLPALVTHVLQNISLEDIEAKEKRILAMRESHFTLPAVMRHIRGFLLSKETDLVCQILPSSIRDGPMTKAGKLEENKRERAKRGIPEPE